MNEVRLLREYSGATQAGLAGAAGTSQPTIAAYESGAKSPSVRTLRRLARSVGVELFVSYHPPMTREETRSLVLHRAIARRLEESPEGTLRQARVTLRRMLRVVAPGSRLLREWSLILKRPTPAIVDAMLDPSPWGREMRHVTPFAGVLDAKARADVYRSFSRQMERKRP